MRKGNQAVWIGVIVIVAIIVVSLVIWGAVALFNKCSAASDCADKIAACESAAEQNKQSYELQIGDYQEKTAMLNDSLIMCGQNLSQCNSSLTACKNETADLHVTVANYEKRDQYTFHLTIFQIASYAVSILLIGVTIPLSFSPQYRDRDNYLLWILIGIAIILILCGIIDPIDLLLSQL